MNRPDKKNALTRAMYGAMAAALRDGDADASLRVNVILGVPGAFSAGQRPQRLHGDRHRRRGRPRRSGISSPRSPARKSRSISGVDGIAVGIGTTINLHCDLTFATPRTDVPHALRRPRPGAGGRLQPARPGTVIGRQQAFALLALGERLFGRAGEGGRPDLRRRAGRRAREDRA